VFDICSFVFIFRLLEGYLNPNPSTNLGGKKEENKMVVSKER
jgi:hypothetical protein